MTEPGDDWLRRQFLKTFAEGVVLKKRANLEHDRSEAMNPETVAVRIARIKSTLFKTQYCRTAVIFFNL